MSSKIGFEYAFNMDTQKYELAFFVFKPDGTTKVCAMERAGYASKDSSFKATSIETNLLMAVKAGLNAINKELELE